MIFSSEEPENPFWKNNLNLIDIALKKCSLKLFKKFIQCNNIFVENLKKSQNEYLIFIHFLF